MTFAEFWALTPADVTLALDAHERRERSAYWRAGLVTAAIVNANRAKGQRPVKAEDFVPKPRPTRSQGPQQQASLFRMYTIAMGGEVITSGH